MKHILFLLIFMFSLMLNVFSQNEETILTIGNTKVSKAEFERIYKKNNNNLYNESDKKSPKEYLDLFINFKLKVIEAENFKMDTSSIFTSELEGYRKELAAPYLTDVKFNEQMVKELYNRKTKEVNASHILLTIEKNATEEQEQAVLDKIVKISNEILAGKDFNEAAAEYSQDPSAKTNKGNLGYFSAFQMVVPFENAAFSTPVGEISEPVRSSLGYHLLKVHDVRENKGELLVVHIMKMFPQGATSEVKNKLKADIDAIFKELQEGADFSELAKTKSDDKRSASKGGEMPWFARGRMIPEFANPAFELVNNGDYTQPVETQFGYHIIKKINSRPILSFEESREDIESRIKKDPTRSITSKKAFLYKLKAEYDFKENSEGKEKLKSKNIEEEISFPIFELFRLNDKNYDFEAFQVFLQNKKIKVGTYSSKYDEWIDEEITNFEDSKLEEKYPEFRYLMQEYHDGILLFNISEEKIWNFAAQDSTGLEAFYEKNSKKYFWEERFKGSIITCKNTEIRDEAEKFLAEEITSEEILDLLNVENEMITITDGTWEKGSNPIVDYFVWNETKPDDLDVEVTFIRGNKIESEPKNLEEARGLFISDYQNFLEENWLKTLRRKYKIKINNKLIKTIEGV